MHICHFIGIEAQQRERGCRKMAPMEVVGAYRIAKTHPFYSGMQFHFVALSLPLGIS